MLQELHVQSFASPRSSFQQCVMKITIEGAAST